MSDSSSRPFKVIEDNETEGGLPATSSIAGKLAALDKAHSRPITWLIVCGILLLAAIVFGTAMLAFHFRDRALANSERELSNTAMLLSAHLDQEFQKLELVQNSIIARMQSLGVASREDYERQMSGKDVHLMLKDKITGLPHLAYLGLVNSKGEIINASSQWPVPTLNVADRHYFQTLKSETQLLSFVSEPMRSRVDGTWAINLSRKLVAPNGEFLGLVGGAIELQYFEKYFGSLALGDYSSISLFRNDGVLLVRHPRIEETVGRPFLAFNEVLKNSDRGTIRLVGRMDGKDRLLAAHRLAHYPLYVSVGVDVAAALADWEEQTKFLIGVAALSVLAVSLIIFLIVRQLLQGHKWSEQRLADQKLRLDTALNNMSQGLLMLDSSKRIVVCNDRYIDMYGLSREVVKPGCTIRELIRHRKKTGSFFGDIDQYCSDIDRALAEEKTTSIVVETTGDRWIHIVNQPMAKGGWVVTHEDITGQRRAEEERDRNREFLDLVIENVPSTIFVKDAEKRYVLMNKAGEKLWGIPRDKFIGMTAYDVFPKAYADIITERDDQLFKSEGPLFFDDHPVSSPGNGVRSVTSKIISVHSADRAHQYLLGLVEDITERKRANEWIAHLENCDALTDLPNRALFRTQLEQSLKWIRRGERLAVLYLDLDYFKNVNDTLGHPVGDELLKAVAGRLRSCVRDTDTIARLGGDEFAIIQTAIEQPTDTTVLVERIHGAIRAPYDLNGHQLIADVSIGIALAPDDGSEPDQLLKNADLALYGAKADGRGTYRFFEPEMDARMKKRRDLEFDLRKALASGELELHFQPLVNLQHNKISSCEALLRWHHPERGMISPAEFISVAEETGLIVQIGEWVLRQACATAATWPSDIKVAVNVSSAQFRGQSLLQVVISALAASNLSPNRLELEITESVLLRNSEATLHMLHQLRELGVRIVMDDFGTGYSSLSYLRSFPFDKLKIDRSFIGDLSNSAEALSIIHAITSLASGLNMTTTAEGVETEQQLVKVRAANCTEMQGYIFSPPRPADEILQLLLAEVQKAERAA